MQIFPHQQIQCVTHSTIASECDKIDVIKTDFSSERSRTTPNIVTVKNFSHFAVSQKRVPNRIRTNARQISYITCGHTKTLILAVFFPVLAKYCRLFDTFFFASKCDRDIFKVNKRMMYIYIKPLQTISKTLKRNLFALRSYTQNRYKSISRVRSDLLKKNFTTKQIPRWIFKILNR